MLRKKKLKHAKKVDKMAYELAKKYVYNWNDVSLVWLNRQDAFEVDGDKHIVICYSFRGLLE